MTHGRRAIRGLIESGRERGFKPLLNPLKFVTRALIFVIDAAPNRADYYKGGQENV